MKHSNLLIVIGILVVIGVVIGIYYYFRKTNHESFVCIPRSVYENFVCSGTPYYCKEVTNQQQCKAYPACSWNGSGGSPPSAGSSSPPSAGSSSPPSAGSSSPPSAGGGSSPPSAGGSSSPPSAGGSSSPPSAGGKVVGFWYGYAGSCAKGKPPSGTWAFAFPGSLLTTVPPPTPPNIPKGNFTKKLVTSGGGGTTWGDKIYTAQEGLLSKIKSAGYDGVCYDWEMTGPDHTTAGFNSLMSKTKAAGLICVVTSTAEGPYQWGAPSKDATGINWDNIDYFVPQLYGASGAMSSGWQTYAKFWKTGGTSLHGVQFKAPPNNKMLWGVTPGQGSAAQGVGGGSGYIEWCYDPNSA